MVKPTDELMALTPREIEVLKLAARGHSNAQVVRMFWVTEQTVKFHLSNVYRKLRVANRTEASRWAQMNGLLDHDDPADLPGPATTAPPVGTPVRRQD